MSSATSPFETVDIGRRDLGPTDVLIDIAYAGICHTDVHHARAEFGVTHYPIVPGHEIAGTITAVGEDVRKFKVGDHAGIGCLVDSCRDCHSCDAGLESYCRTGKVLTYNGIAHDGSVTYGGYSEAVVVDERFAVVIPGTMDLRSTAPLLCAGITMYSPLRHWNAGPATRVGIIGFGGLGHVGVQISSAIGAHTTVINLGEEQEADARRFGANEYRLADDPSTFTELEDSLDLIISTVPVSFDLNPHLNLLAQHGTFVNVGVPEVPISIEPYSLFTNRRSISGTMSGGMPETQEMIDFCARHGIGAQTELIDPSFIDDAYDRLVAGDVRYRFVIDASSFSSE
jgi:alcohol dehydrogenase (NADP+)